MQETYRSIGRLAAFTVLSAPFLFSLLVWSIVGLVETVAEAMVEAGVRTREAAQLVFLAPASLPNWCLCRGRQSPIATQHHHSPANISRTGMEKCRKPQSMYLGVRQNTPNSQRPSKCLKATQTLKFEFDKKIRFLLT